MTVPRIRRVQPARVAVRLGLCLAAAAFSIWIYLVETRDGVCSGLDDFLLLLSVPLALVWTRRVFRVTSLLLAAFYVYIGFASVWCAGAFLLQVPLLGAAGLVGPGKPHLSSTGSQPK